MKTANEGTDSGEAIVGPGLLDLCTAELRLCVHDPAAAAPIFKRAGTAEERCQVGVRPSGFCQTVTARQHVTMHISQCP